jgi:hypothetical protein
MSYLSLGVEATRNSGRVITDDIELVKKLSIAKLADDINLFDPRANFHDNFDVEAGTEGNYASKAVGATWASKAANGFYSGYYKSIQETTLDDDLRHWYEFARDCDDSIGSVNLTPDFDTFVLGTIGYAFDSDGGKSASATTFTGFANAAAWTISFAYKANAAATGETLLELANTSGNDYIEIIINAGDITATYYDSVPAAKWTVTRTITHGTSVFHQVTLVHATNGTVSLYVDALATVTDVEGATYNYSTINGIYLLRDEAGGGGSKADVVIDEIGIFDAAKTEAWHDSIYNAGNFVSYQPIDYTNITAEDTSCLAWLRFDGDLRDRKEYIFDNPDVADAGSPTYVAAGDAIFSGVQALEGAADVGRVFDCTSNFAGGDFTISFFIQRDPGIAGDETLCTFSNGSDAMFMFIDSSMRINVEGDEGDEFELQSSAISTNAWHHIAVTFDGTDAYTLYVDGVSEDTTTSDGTDNYSDYDQFILMGDYDGAWSENFVGNMDEFGFFDEEKDLAWSQGSYGNTPLDDEGNTDVAIVQARRYEIFQAATVTMGLTSLGDAIDLFVSVEAIRVTTLSGAGEGSASITFDIVLSGALGTLSDQQVNEWIFLGEDDWPGVKNSVLTFNITPTTKGEPTLYYPVFAGFNLEAIVAATADSITI